MLKHEETQQSAGEVRVKKEELARAISILEARRQAEAQAQEGTVVIGDVLQVLQINVPAEDVLHEIEAMRDGQPQEEVLERPVDPLRTADAKLVAGIVLVPLAAVVLGGLIFHPAPPTQSGFTNYSPSSVVSKPSPTSFVMSSPIDPSSGATGQEMDEGGFNASSVLKMLSAVPDNQAVHCSSNSLWQLVSANAQQRQTAPLTPRRFNRGFWHYTHSPLDAAALAKSNQKFDVRPGLKKPWEIIKHDGNLYFRGWVAAKFTKAQAAKRPVIVHAYPRSFDAGITPQQITLKADFTLSPNFEWQLKAKEDASEMVVDDVTPDSHMWEKW